MTRNWLPLSIAGLSRRRSNPTTPRPGRTWTLGPPLRLEPLEDRATPAAVSWDGGGNGTSWTDARNWAGDVLPGPADDVTIPAGASAVNYADGSSAVNSLTISRPLTVAVGTLTAAGAATLASAAVTGGTLVVGGPA